jgi:hypothetical protein
MKFSSTDTIIDRLTISAPRPVDANTVAADLQRASWPAPADGSWIFIRSLHVRSQKTQVAEHAAAAARTSVAHAVDGRLPGAAHAQAVRFRTLTQMLACLLADVVSGHAGSVWYWQAWMRLFRLPRAQALKQVLSEHAERMPEIVEELGARNLLSTVWTHLSNDGAQQLLMELGRVTQLRLYPSASGGELHPSLPHEDEEPWLDDLQTARSWPAIVRRWSAPLSGINAAEPRHQLAVALIALESFPVYLTRDPLRALRIVAGVLHIRTALNCDQALDESTDLFAAPPGPNDEIRRNQHNRVDSARARKAAEESPLPTLEPKPETTTAAKERSAFYERMDVPSISGHQWPESFRPTTAGNPELTDPSRQIVHEGDAEGAISALDASAPGETQDAEPTFHTAQGGLFYLINALNHPSVRSLIDDHNAWTALPSGWAWLFRLGKSLELDLEDPAVAFLAHQMGFETVRQMEELPPLPLSGQILRLLDKMYARHGVWNPALLQLKARVSYSASHLDVQFPMSAAKLPVRLSGLDINPGWVAWLGRVVTFYYVHSQSEGVS